MLKRSMLTIITILLCVPSHTSFAEQSSKDIQTLEIAFKDYHVRYQENAPDYEDGWLKGLRFSYKNQNATTQSYWRVLYEKTNHENNYIGALQDNEGNNLGPYNTTTKNIKTTSEIIFANPVSDSNHEYAYTGIGFHSWDRTILGSASENVATCLEKYSWGYIPVGYRSEYKINDKWDGAIDIAIRFMFNGKMKSPNPSNIDPFQVNLGNKPGFKVEIPYTYKMDSQWSLTLTPWYEYWKIGQSNLVPQTVNGVPQYNAQGYQLGVYEPSSTTKQVGIDIGLSCRF